MKTRKIAILFFVILLFMSISNLTFAQSNQKLNNNLIDIQSVISQKDLIKFEWKELKGYIYNVYNNEDLLYSGAENSFIHSGLESSSMYSYTIEAVNSKGSVIDVAKVQTETKSDFQSIYVESDNNNPLDDLTITTIVKQNLIKINWDNIYNVEKYDIYRNNIFLFSVDDSQFIDSNINNYYDYTYTIYAKRKVSQEIINQRKSQIRENGIIITEEDKEQLKYDQIQIIKEIGSNYNDLISRFDQPNNISDMSSTSSSVKQWNIRYNTFIPLNYADNPWGIIPFWTNIEYFSGDGQNRGWSATSTRYRTRTDVTVCFCSAGQSVAMNKYVSPTVGYDSNYDVVTSATDSGNGIQLSNISLSSTKITFKVNHASGNPLASSPDIDYNYNGEFYSNGNYKLVGDHDQAPSHEVYMTGFNSSAWQVMHQRTHQGFTYLWPWMSNYYWTKSNF